MRNTEIVIEQGCDQNGQPEEFTWDLYPLVDSSELQHLTDEGLPKEGTLIRKGMVVVGKRGRGTAFDPEKLPNSLEMHSCKREEVASKYANFWTNTSFYAAQDMGHVAKAYFETRGSKLCAVVELTSEPSQFTNQP